MLSACVYWLFYWRFLTSLPSISDRDNSSAAVIVAPDWINLFERKVEKNRHPVSGHTFVFNTCVVFLFSSINDRMQIDKKVATLHWTDICLFFNFSNRWQRDKVFESVESTLLAWNISLAQVFAEHSLWQVNLILFWLIKLLNNYFYFLTDRCHSLAVYRCGRRLMSVTHFIHQVPAKNTLEARCLLKEVGTFPLIKGSFLTSLFSLSLSLSHSLSLSLPPFPSAYHSFRVEIAYQMLFRKRTDHRPLLNQTTSRKSLLLSVVYFFAKQFIFCSKKVSSFFRKINPFISSRPNKLNRSKLTKNFEFLFSLYVQRGATG